MPSVYQEFVNIAKGPSLSEFFDVAFSEASFSVYVVGGCPVSTWVVAVVDHEAAGCIILSAPGFRESYAYGNPAGAREVFHNLLKHKIHELIAPDVSVRPAH